MCHAGLIALYLVRQVEAVFNHIPELKSVSEPQRESYYINGRATSLLIIDSCTSPILEKIIGKQNTCLLAEYCRHGSSEVSNKEQGAAS